MITIQRPESRSPIRGPRLPALRLFNPAILRPFLPTLVAIISMILSGCGPTTITLGGQRDQRLKTKTVLYEGAVLPRIAIVDVSGMIYNASRPRLLSVAENPVSRLHEQLVQAAKDHRVKAVLLRINSPGGTVTATDAMYRQVMRFKEKSGKPVVALMMDVAASGGFYLACSADQIVAYPTTITGSIGVVIHTISLQVALQRFGVQTQTMASGPNKAAGSLFSTLQPEQRKIFQALIDDFYRSFVAVVRERRPIADDQLKVVTDGRIFSGTRAAELGLVDRIGDLHTAFALAKSRAGVSRANLVVYHRPARYVGSPYATQLESPSTAGSARTQINIAQFNFPDIGDLTSGFYYLWEPVLP